MSVKIIKLGGGLVYTINIPDTPSEPTIILPDQIILNHLEEIFKLEKMIEEAINLPKGVEPHSWSDYKNNK